MIKPVRMPRRRRTIAALALLLALGCMLSGCVRLQRDVSLNNDGTGTYSFAISFSDKLVAVAGTSFALQMKTCGALVETSGGKYATSDANGYSTWTFTWQFKSLSRLNSLLSANASFCTVSNTNIPTSATANDAFSVAAHAHFFTTTYVLTGHMTFALQSAGTSQDPNTVELLKEAYSAFTITMPGWVSTHSSGGSVNGATVTYTAHNGNTLDFEVVGEGLNISAILVVGGGVLLLIGLGALVIWLFRRPSAADHERAAIEAPIAPTGYLD